MSDYPRPVPSESEQRAVAQLLRAFSLALPGQQKMIVASLMIENISLTHEVNDHRAARGFDLLPTYNPLEDK